MNASVWIRGIMSKNVSGEEFIIHVCTCIERQLQEWDPKFEVFLMKMKDYEIHIRNESEFYHTSVSELVLKELQDKSPFALDRKIWQDLIDQGLETIEGTGNYLEYVFW